MFTHLEPPLKEKALALQNILQNFGPAFCIACSGGLDSRFLAFFAQKTGCVFSLIHITGKHIDPRETEYLKQWSTKHKIPLFLLPLNVLENPEIAGNSKERCYYCKKTAFQTMLDFMHLQNTLKSGTVLCDGSHADDKNVYRPGLRALHELGIQSPLALANFSKTDIRNAGMAMGLDNYSQKARPCLLTRLPYNTPIDEELLMQLTRAEVFFEKELTKLFGENIPDFRVRRIDNKLYFHYTEYVTEEQISTLQKALENAELPPVHFERLNVLSGYFDR